MEKVIARYKFLYHKDKKLMTKQKVKTPIIFQKLQLVSGRLFCSLILIKISDWTGGIIQRVGYTLVGIGF